MTIKPSTGSQAASVRELKPAPYNPRKITKDRQNMLQKSLETFGDLSGIVFNIRTGHLVGGHQRVKLMERRYPIEKQPSSDSTGTVAIGYIRTPYGQVPYREVDWEEDREKAANIAANKHRGEFDNEKLRELLESIDTGSFEMEIVGFSEAELENLMTWTGGDKAANDKAHDATIATAPPEGRAPVQKVPGVEKSDIPPDPITMPPKLPKQEKPSNEGPHLQPADPPRGKPMVNYNIIFDDQRQYDEYQNYIRVLRKQYPDLETHAQRMMKHLHGVCPEISID
jgi:hypothetical protein